MTGGKHIGIAHISSIESLTKMSAVVTSAGLPYLSSLFFMISRVLNPSFCEGRLLCDLISPRAVNRNEDFLLDDV